MSDYQPTAKQEQAIREFLHEAVVPLIEDVLVKKLGQAMAYLKEQQQPEQEPVAKYTGKYYRCPIVNLYQDIPLGTLLYTAPPKREWVGLTDEEIDDWFFQRLKQAGDGWALDDVVRAVEAKLKEKNT